MGSVTVRPRENLTESQNEIVNVKRKKNGHHGLEKYYVPDSIVIVGKINE